MATNLINTNTQSASGNYQVLNNNDNFHQHHHQYHNQAGLFEDSLSCSLPGGAGGGSSLSSSSASYFYYNEQQPHLSINEPTDGYSDSATSATGGNRRTTTSTRTPTPNHQDDDGYVHHLDLDLQPEHHNNDHHNHIESQWHHNGSNHSKRSKSSVSQPIQVPARQMKRNLNRLKLSMMKEDPLMMGLMVDSSSSSSSNISNGGVRSNNSHSGSLASGFGGGHLERSSPIEPAIEGVIEGLLKEEYDDETTNGSEFTSFSAGNRRRRPRQTSQQRDELDELIVNDLDGHHHHQQYEEVDDPFRNGERNRPSIENIAAFDDDDAFLNQEFNANHHNRYPIDEFDCEHLTAGEDPMRLFASIQALAKSLHDDDELFGSLPPKRMLESPIRSIALY